MAIHEKTTGFMAEFRKFIARGNVMDMAVGVIVGGAFKAIADSLVADIINPILGIFAGNNDALASLAIQLPGGGALHGGQLHQCGHQFPHHGLCGLLYRQGPQPLPPEGGGRSSPASGPLCRRETAHRDPRPAEGAELIPNRPGGVPPPPRRDAALLF